MPLLTGEDVQVSVGGRQLLSVPSLAVATAASLTDGTVPAQFAVSVVLATALAVRRVARSVARQAAY